MKLVITWGVENLQKWQRVYVDGKYRSDNFWVVEAIRELTGIKDVTYMSMHDSTNDYDEHEDGYRNECDHHFVEGKIIMGEYYFNFMIHFDKLEEELMTLRNRIIEHIEKEDFTKEVVFQVSDQGLERLNECIDD